MGKFLQTFVAYHGCGNCYQDGTNKIDKKNICYIKKYNPFWEKPIDVHNKVQTRAQLKKKAKTSANYQVRYHKWIQFISKDSFTSSDFSSDTDTDSNSDSNSESDFGSLINNASETEQILSDNETDKLIIDETTDKNLDNSNETDKKMLVINIHETSDNKLQTETPDNK